MHKDDKLFFNVTLFLKEDGLDLVGFDFKEGLMFLEGIDE